jgi:hypothetical protein
MKSKRTKMPVIASERSKHFKLVKITFQNYKVKEFHHHFEFNRPYLN